MVNLDEFPDEPVPLISITEGTDDITVNEKALDILQKITGKISVIAVAGLYRTGKSSLLNWLLDRQNGFKVGPTIQACTRGIWLWGRPKERTLENGEKVWVLMLDSEGLGGLEASQQYDARIFSLTTLLCSKLIYNSQGSVDEKAISHLSFIANLTKHIRVRSHTNDNEDDGQDFQNFFPSFLWVVRDFTLELVDEDGDPISSTEYLEKALAPQMGFNQATMERNRVRQMMTSFFQKRECFTLVRPLHDEKALQQIDEQPLSSLRPEFQKQIEQLKDLVFSGLQPKSMNNKPLTGTMFAGLLQAYVDAINHGSVPTISSAWEGVTMSECRNAMNQAITHFKDHAAKEAGMAVLPLDQDDLSNVLNALEAEAKSYYASHAVGDATKKFRDEMMVKIGELIAQIRETNAAASKETCNRHLQTVFSEIIQPRLNDSEKCYNSMQEFTDDWANFREKYLQVARGPEKLTLLCTFTETKMAEAMRIILVRRENQYEQKLRSAEEKAAKSAEQLSMVGGREEVFKHRIEAMQNESADLLSTRARLEAETQAQEAIIEKLHDQVRSNEREKEQVEVEKRHYAESLAGEQTKHSDTAEQFQKLKDEYTKLLREKERQDMEIGLLADENDTLRKGAPCTCVIS